MPGSVAVVAVSESAPDGEFETELSVALPALPANSTGPSATSQQVAAPPVPTESIGVSVPLPCSLKLATALGPASPTSTWSTPVNASANGTVARLGVDDRRRRRAGPELLTANTSIAFVLAFVVTSSCCRSG